MESSIQRLARSETGEPEFAAAVVQQVAGCRFELDGRYAILDPVGQGAFGIVVAAKDQKNQTERNVAIKKIENVFQNATLAKRTLRELKILRLLKHENIMSLETIQLPDLDSFDELYVVTELMDTDLSSLIKSQNALNDEHCQYFIYQVLRGLKFVHSAKMLHRDLKPRNILVNQNCDLKICDFGLARAAIFGNKIYAPKMTDLVATLWYRAPELLLSNKRYTAAIDMWSVGTILAELLGRRPIFPGQDQFNQLELIINMLGTPTAEEMGVIQNASARDVIKSFGPRQRRDLAQLFPTANPLGIDLLSKLLCWDAAKRLTVEQALEHPYLEEYHCPEDEPSSQTASLFDFEFERQRLNLAQIRQLLYEEILLYHSQGFRAEYERTKLEFASQGEEEKINLVPEIPGTADQSTTESSEEELVTN